MTDLKEKTKEGRETLWKAYQNPVEWEGLYKDLGEITANEIESVKLGIKLIHHLPIEPVSLPPVIIWVVEEALYGWNRRCYSNSRTISDASYSLRKIVDAFAADNFYFQQLSNLSISNLTNLNEFLADLKRNNRTKHSKSDYKQATQETRTYQCNKIQQFFSSYRINSFHKSEKYCSVQMKEDLNQCLEALNHRTENYLEIMRKSLKASQTENIFVTKENLLITGATLALLGLNEFVKLEQLFNVNPKCKHQFEFILAFDAFLSQLRRQFGPKRRIGIMHLVRENGVYKQCSLTGLRVFDVQDTDSLVQSINSLQ